MNEYCGDCDHLDRRAGREYKNIWTGETKYRCEITGEYKKVNDPACSNLKPLKKDTGGYTPSGCYITTIVCDVLGYDDDCEILNTLRQFRDNYLKNHVEYLSLLLEYDQKGPIISEFIRNDKDNVRLCLELVKDYLIPCVQKIKKEEYDDAVVIYEFMVEELYDKYKILSKSIKLDTNYDIETLGKGRVRKINPSEN